MRHVLILASTLGALAIGALSLAGCDEGSTEGSTGASGGGTGGGPGGAGGEGASALRKACAAFAAAACDRQDACTPFPLKLEYGDRAACEAALGSRCTGAAALAGVTATAADIQACADVYKAASCE